MPPIDWVHVALFAAGMLIPVLQQWIAARQQPGTPTTSGTPDHTRPIIDALTSIIHGMIPLLTPQPATPQPSPAIPGGVASALSNIDPATLAALLSALKSPDKKP
jgi:hypothetical protein